MSGPSAEERAESVGGFSRKDVANRLLVAVSIDFNEPRDYLRRLLTAAAIMLDRDAAADAAGYARGMDEATKKDQPRREAYLGTIQGLEHKVKELEAKLVKG